MQIHRRISLPALLALVLTACTTTPRASERGPQAVPDAARVEAVQPTPSAARAADPAPDRAASNVSAPTPPSAEPTSSTTTGSRDLRFVVLHTNDVHGQALTRKGTWIDKQNPPQVGGLPRLAAYVNQVREEARREHEELIVVDGGDWYQGTPEGLVDDGLAFVSALTLVGYDAMCIGNHEFDRGLPNLLRLIRSARVPAVCANLHPKGAAERVAWVPPYRLIERGGVKIALVGLLTTVTPEITHKDALTLDFTPPADELRAIEHELAGHVDWVLPLTHLGVDGDRQLAREFPDLPLIVGGHSHTVLREGVREGGTLIVQAGTKIGSVGRVDLVVHVPGSGEADRRVRVIESKARLVDLVQEPTDEFRASEVEARCAAIEEQTKAKMAEVVGALGAAATRSKDPVVSGSVGNLLADVLRERAKADVAFMNRGGIRTDLDAGPVTRREVFEIMPFDNTLVTVEMRGAELEELVRRSVEGAAHSGLEFSGLIVDVDVDAAGKRKLAGLRVGGAPLELEREYRVAMNSFMADGGDAYLDKDKVVSRQDTGLLIRDVLEDALAAKKELVPAGENRYEVTRR